MYWEGPEANPSFLPEVFKNLEGENSKFISPFTGFEVSPLEYLSGDPLSPIPPKRCLVRVFMKGSLGPEEFVDLPGLKSFLLRCLPSSRTPYSSAVYFSVLTDKSEQLWKASAPWDLKRVFRRKRR